jgi:hypothetical protein
MAAPDIDLWPTDIGKGKITTPAAILRQQASLLGKRTNNLLEAKVDTITQGDTFMHRFAIEAPALGNYKYILFVLSHSVELYPISISQTPSGVYPDSASISNGIRSEKELLDWLKWVLNRDETKRVINGLLSQIES